MTKNVFLSVPLSHIPYIFVLFQRRQELPVPPSIGGQFRNLEGKSSLYALRIREYDIMGTKFHH